MWDRTPHGLCPDFCGFVRGNLTVGDASGALSMNRCWGIGGCTGQQLLPAIGVCISGLDLEKALS